MDQATSTIMVIGDDPDFRYLMRRYVRKSAHQILFAHLSEDTLSLARRERPAAIVLEADLGGIVSWGVLRALKADRTTREIPVVFCSWLDEKERSLKEGASIYLRKPILYADFLAALRDVGLQPPA